MLHHTYSRAARTVLGRFDFAVVDAGFGPQIVWDAGAFSPPIIDQAILDAIDAKVVELSMTEEKLRAIAAVSARADELGQLIAGAAPRFEQLSWSDKREAAVVAKAVFDVSGTPTTADDPRIQMLLAELSVTQPAGLDAGLEDLADKVLANVDLASAANYWNAVGVIAGQRRVTHAAIKALSDPVTFADDLAAILSAAEANAQALLASLMG